MRWLIVLAMCFAPTAFAGQVATSDGSLAGEEGWCAGQVIRIGTTMAYACRESGASGYGTVHEIRLLPQRTVADPNPDPGAALVAAVDACLGITTELGLDTGPSGCSIVVPTTDYTITAPAIFNTSAGTRIAPIDIDFRGAEVTMDIPAADASATLDPDTRGTCNLAAQGRFVTVTDATDVDDLSTGGGAVTTNHWCNGTSWEVGWPAFFFGGPGTSRIRNITIRNLRGVFDTDTTVGVRQRFVVVSREAGDPVKSNGGVQDLKLRDVMISGTTDNYPIGVDIGGPRGGSGGPTAGTGNTCENITIENLVADFVSDTGFGAWVRNCSDIAFVNHHFEHGGRLRVGEDQASELQPKNVTIVNGTWEGCDDGPCFELLSGQVTMSGYIDGDKDGADAGNLARIGGTVSPGVILTSDGFRWESVAATDGQIFLGNIASWTQGGGYFRSHDDGTAAFLVADSGADIEVLKILDADFVSNGELVMVDLSARDATSDQSICPGCISGQSTGLYYADIGQVMTDGNCLTNRANAATSACAGGSNNIDITGTGVAGGSDWINEIRVAAVSDSSSTWADAETVCFRARVSDLVSTDVDLTDGSAPNDDLCMDGTQAPGVASHQVNVRNTQAGMYRTEIVNPVDGDDGETTGIFAEILYHKLSW